MASPLTSQDFAQMGDAFINVTVHFEGKDRMMEFPCNLDDQSIFSLVLEEISEMDRNKPTSEVVDRVEAMYVLFSVSGSDTISDIPNRSPLNASEIRSVVLRDGMLLGAKRGTLSQNADAGLLANGGMKLTVDVTPSCSV